MAGTKDAEVHGRSVYLSHFYNGKTLGVFRYYRFPENIWSSKLDQLQFMDAWLNEGPTVGPTNNSALENSHGHG